MKQSDLIKKIDNTLFTAFEAVQGLRLLKNPEQLDVFLSLANKRHERATQEDADKLAENIRWTDEAISAVRDRYHLQIPEISELLQFAEGTLGRAAGEFFRDNKLDPKAVTHPPVTDDLSYLIAHASETHDLWHVVTGFAPDLDGEAGVAAFSAAQYGSPLQFGISAGTLAAGLNQDPWHLENRLEAVVKGWQMGKAAYPLLGIRWHELWNESLESIRTKYRV